MSKGWNSLDSLSGADKAARSRNLQTKRAAKKQRRREKTKRAELTKKQRKAKKKQARIVSDGFLQSYAWKKLRYQALLKHGATCQCCGRTRKDGATMNVDHIKPRKKYPELALDINNLQVLCGTCNHGKGNWDQTDWRT